MWANESIFYHIYPLGFVGAEERNDFCSEPKNRIFKVVEWIDQIKKIGANALYIGPLFESTAHGYDTSDYFKIDRRLGTNEDFKKVAQELHSNGIKIVLDGVFNHVGRDFWAFKDVKENRQNSRYCSWFNISFDRNNNYNDGFSYENWEGCDDLVRLNLHNHEVKNHLFHAIKTWVEDYDIDGLRLDVAYCLDKGFLSELRQFCKGLKSDFWLMGETLHGDYNQWMNDEMLDSVTNYECYKGLFSSCNSKNMFEIAHSLQRQFSEESHSIYKGKHLYSFLDNHDVSRISSILSNKKHLESLYTLLFTMPGIPSVYYGSEWGVEGSKNNGDLDLRPNLNLQADNSLTNHISNLSKIRKDHSSLSYGKYKQINLTNETYSFVRELDSESIVTSINIGDKPFELKYNQINGNIPPYSSKVFVNGECVLASVN